MKQNEIIEMWKNSGDLEIIGMPYSKIEAFAKLVAAKAVEREREACAKMCDEFDQWQSIEELSVAIRARGEQQCCDKT